jgi:hypothetical protein
METINNKNMNEMENMETMMKDVESKDTDHDMSLPVVETKREVPKNCNKMLCKAFYKGGECTHFPECFFAHSLKDLIIPDCHFGERCNKVFINSAGKLVDQPMTEFTCSRKHRSETMDSFYDRVGLSKFKGIEVTRRPTKREYVQQHRPSNHVSRVNTMTGNRPLSLRPSQTFRPASLSVGPTGPDSPVLGLPKEMAMETLKLLISSGKNIKIEFK